MNKTSEPNLPKAMTIALLTFTGILVGAGAISFLIRSVQDEPVPIVKPSSDYNPRSTTSADGRFIRTEIEFSPGVIYIHIKDTKEYGHEYLETQSSIIRL